VASTHFIPIRVLLNFSQLLQTLDLIFNQYDRYIEQFPEPFCTQVEEVTEISKSCLADKINNFVDILDALPQHTIITRDKRFLDLVALGITNLHENHFKAMDQKLDDFSNKLAMILKINKVHFAKMTDFMEQKFSTAVTILERLIHTAYNNCLSPRCPSSRGVARNC
jgi:hypothetical protein